MLSAGPQLQRYRRVGEKGEQVMAARTRRGLGPSHLLITPDRAGNVVGIDPHKRTLSAAVVDARGGLLAGEHFRVSGEGHRALVAWACSFGPVARWGVENASGWGETVRSSVCERRGDCCWLCLAGVA